MDRALTEAHPGDATLWCNRAVTEVLLHDLPAARRSLARSLALDPEDAIAHRLEERLARYEAGQPLPSSLDELSRG